MDDTNPGTPDDGGAPAFAEPVGPADMAAHADLPDDWQPGDGVALPHTGARDDSVFGPELTDDQAAQAFRLVTKGGTS